MMNPSLTSLTDLLQLASADDRANLQKIIGTSFGDSPKLLADHFNYLHSGAVGQLFRRRSYKQLVTDLADYIKIDWDGILRGRHWDDLSVGEIEDAIVFTSLGAMLSRLSDDERTAFAEELGKEANDPNLIPELLAGGSMILARLSGMKIYLLATTTVGALTAGIGITLPFAFYTTMTSTLKVLLGPVGWAALGGSILFAVNKTNYDKLLPGVVFVSYIRHKLDHEGQIRTPIKR